MSGFLYCSRGCAPNCSALSLEGGGGTLFFKCVREPAEKLRLLSELVPGCPCGGCLATEPEQMKKIFRLLDRVRAAPRGMAERLAPGQRVRHVIRMGSERSWTAVYRDGALHSNGQRYLTLGGFAVAHWKSVGGTPRAPAERECELESGGGWRPYNGGPLDGGR